MTEIAQQLRQKIETAGPISFARFMEIALYCPEFGYYERPERVIGRSGDFYTSVSTGALFGELLAFQFAEWLDQVGRAVPSTPQVPKRLQLVEAGAHNGQLALDILNWLSLNRADLCQCLDYCIIEPSRIRQEWQRRKLEQFAGQVWWIDPNVLFGPASHPLSGIIFSNELLDAFPIYRFGWNATEQTWFEWGVGFKDGKFVWEKMTGPSSASFVVQAVFNLPRELMAALPDGFTIEHSPGAASWWGHAASVLHAGKIMTLDYGLTQEEMFTPHHATGTLRSYYRHHIADPLSNPGEQDLTAHVNFSQLQGAGEAAGLHTESFCSQAQFLVGIADKLSARQSPQWSSAQMRQFQALTHPEFLGRAFRVLVQSR
jgi:SAM-dependent MidA family methyltransferase